jgi:hypothetical protein
MSGSNKNLRKQTLLQASLLPVSLPTTAYSVAELFNNAASYSSYEQGCLWIAAVLGGSVLTLTLINLCRLIGTSVPRLFPKGPTLSFATS